MLEGEARDAEEVGVASEPEALSDQDVAAETPPLPTEPTQTEEASEEGNQAETEAAASLEEPAHEEDTDSVPPQSPQPTERADEQADTAIAISAPAESPSPSAPPSPAPPEEPAATAEDPTGSMDRLLAPSRAPSASSDDSEGPRSASRQPAAVPAKHSSPRIVMLPPVPKQSPKEKEAAAAKERMRRELADAQSQLSPERREPVPRFSKAPAGPAAGAGTSASPYGGDSSSASPSQRTRTTGAGASASPLPMANAPSSSSFAADEALVAAKREQAIEVKRRLNALQRQLHATRGRTAVRVVEARKREAADRIKASASNLVLRRALVGLEPYGEDELTELSETFNTRLRQLYREPSWIKLFKAIDTDSSGRITYKEVLALTRNELELLPDDIPDEHVKRIFLALDTDRSGFVGCGEFGAFMRRGQHVLADPHHQSWKAKLEERNRRAADSQRQRRDAELNRDLSRANADGSLEPAQEEELILLSRLCNARLASLYGEGAVHSLGADQRPDPTAALTAAAPTQGALSQATWFSLFKRTDENDSGLICFNEWSKLIRGELGVSEGVFSKQRLQAAWLALDVDSSGFINAGEWAAFMRKGEMRKEEDRRLEYALSKKRAARELHDQSEAMRQMRTDDEERIKERHRRAAARQREQKQAKHQRAAEAVAKEVRRRRAEVRRLTDMTDLKKILKKAPAATEEQVVMLAEACNERLVQMADEDDKLMWAPWFRLFKSIDTDGSGQISFDEFVSLVRKELGLLAAQGFGADAVKAVWVAMDTDASGYISCGEFGKFMRKGCNVIANRQGLSRQAKLDERARLAKAQREADKVEIYHGRHFDEIERATAASESDVRRLSEHFNARLAELREMAADETAGGAAVNRTNASDSGQWYHLFKCVDLNSNGYISYNEWRDLVRHELMLPASNVPDAVLRAVWKALDPTGTGLLQCGDFISFMKQGMPAVNRGANAGAHAREQVRQHGERQRATYEAKRSHLKRAQLSELDAEQKAFERRAKKLERELQKELAAVRLTVGGATQPAPLMPTGLAVAEVDDEVEPRKEGEARRSMGDRAAPGRRPSGQQLKGAYSESRLQPVAPRRSRPLIVSASESAMVRLPRI